MFEKIISFFAPNVEPGKSSADAIDPNSAGWQNQDNAFGFDTDPTFSTMFRTRNDLTHIFLHNLYESDPLVNAFVSLWKSDATRKGFELVDKENADLANELKKELQTRFNILGVLSKSVGIDKLFGGGVIFADINDGREHHEPLNENSIKEIFSFRAIEREYAKPHTYDDLIGTETPGEPLHYNLQLISGVKSELITVHKSRIIRIPDFKSDDSLSQIAKQKRFSWPVSRVQVAYDAVKKHGIGVQSITQHLQNMVVDIFKVSDMGKLDSTQKFLAYIRNQWKLKNSMRANVIGSEESLERIGTPIAGIEKILEFINQYVSMSFRVSLSILFSNESGGLGGDTIDGDRLVWFDQVVSYQKNQLVPAVQRILELLGFEKKVDVSNISIVFNDLHEKTEKEKLENRKLAFEADEIIVGMGYPAIFLFESRFSGDEIDLNAFNYDKNLVAEFIEEREQMFQENENENEDENEDNKKPAN